MHTRHLILLIGLLGAAACEDGDSDRRQPLRTEQGLNGDDVGVEADARPTDEPDPARRRPRMDTWPEGCEDEDGDLWPVCPLETDFRQDCDDTEGRIRPFASPSCTPGDDWDCDGQDDTEQPNGCQPANPANNRAPADGD
ncbi:MAG: hypothetical protein R3F60_04055 [bacterium]